MNTLRTLYSWFGSFRKPLALVFLLAGFAPRVAAQGNVWLWTYTFLSSQRPRISTDNQNLIYEQGIGLSCYKLRTKVLNVPGYPDGFHAATSWNNNNLPLDVLPPPATYAAQLYWVKYSDYNANDLISIGTPFNDVTLHITQSDVALTSYWFNQAARPQIASSAPLPPQYKLAAQVLFGPNSPYNATASWNNQGWFLDRLPPPGNYTVNLFWQKFDITGTTAVESGPVRTETITITPAAVGSPIHLLDLSGTITAQDAYDEDGNYTGVDCSGDYYDVTIPFAGQLRISSADTYNKMCLFYDPVAGTVVGSGGPSFSFTANVQPGVYQILVGGYNEGGNYHVTVDAAPSLPQATITSAITASATVGTPFNYTVTANNGANAFYAGGLPLGLTCNQNTGVISGTPSQAGTFTVALYASGPSGFGPSTDLTLTVGKGTPTLTVAGQSAENQVQPLFAVTSAMLPTDAVGAAGLPAPTGAITYTAVRVDTLGATSTVNLINSLPLQMTALYGELRVTANYPGDANYVPATKTVTFVNRDTHKPNAPTNLTPALLGPTSFSLTWTASVELESFVKYYEVSVDNGAQTLTTRTATLSGGIITPTLTTVAVNNVTSGALHLVKVHAVDWFNNPSDWSATLPITTPPAGTPPPTTSQWDDVNGDGLKDELISAATSAFSIFESETGSRTVSYSTTTWEFISVFNVSYGDGWDLYVSGAWHVVDNETTYTVATVRPGFQILAEPGYDYGVTWNVTTPSGQLVRAVLVPTAPLEPASALNSAIHEVLAFNQDPLSAAAFYAYPTTLVRMSKPAGGIQLNLPILGAVQIGTQGGLSGKITLPGGIVINATQGGGATVNIPGSIIPGGVTVTSSGGNVTVSGSPGGGYGVTLGSGGNAALTIPGGGTIGIGPGGASLTTAGGLGISVTGNGQISMSVPQGSGQKLDNALDTLGKLLGIGPVGPNVQVQVVSPGQPLNNGGWAGPLQTDLGNRAPGTYNVAVKVDDDTNTHPNNVVWITLTVQLPAVAIAPDTGMAGVVGDTVPSNLGPSGEKHFVSPKKTAAIADDYVILQVSGVSAATFQNYFQWDTSAGEAVPNEPLKWRVSRATAGKFPARILVKNGGAIAAKINVWIVWAIGQIAQQPNLQFLRQSDTTIDGTSTNSAELTLDRRYVFKFVISPAAIITDSDRPALDGLMDGSAPPPGGTHAMSGDALAGGAARKWDVTRRWSERVVNPNLIPRGKFSSGFGHIYDNQPQLDSIPIPFPSNDAEGNDDAHPDDEDDNPYAATTTQDLSHAIGEITSYDKPTIWMPEAGASDGYLYQEYTKMGEFARLQITGKWYRIADFLEWNESMRIRFQSGQWQNEFSSTGPGN